MESVFKYVFSRSLANKKDESWKRTVFSQSIRTERNGSSFVCSHSPLLLHSILGSLAHPQQHRSAFSGPPQPEPPVIVRDSVLRGPDAQRNVCFHILYKQRWIFEKNFHHCDCMQWKEGSGAWSSRTLSRPLRGLLFFHSFHPIQLRIYIRFTKRFFTRVNVLV